MNAYTLFNQRRGKFGNVGWSAVSAKATKAYSDDHPAVPWLKTLRTASPGKANWLESPHGRASKVAMIEGLGQAWIFANKRQKF